MLTRPIWNPTEHGLVVLVPVAALATLGILSIHATETTAGGLGPRTTKQLVYLAGSLVVMVATLTVSYQQIGRWAYGMFAGMLLLLALLILDKWVNLPLIPVRRGARRWIEFGPVQIQPSELMKVAFILTLARYLQFRKNYRRLAGLIGPFLLTLIPMFLILPEPDLGTVLLLLPVLFVMLFAAGARMLHFSGILLLALCALPLVWNRMHAYQRSRVSAVLMQSQTVRDRVRGLRVRIEDRPDVRRALGRGSVPAVLRAALRDQGIPLSSAAEIETAYPGVRWIVRDGERQLTIRREHGHLNVYAAPGRPWKWLGTPEQARNWQRRHGYQLLHAKAALGSGGLLGWNEKVDSVVLRDRFLPDRQNDFIFAVIGHQWGLLGALLVLGCYALIAIGGVEIAALTNDPFGRLLAVGVVTLISAQALINIGMTLGLMPITGMTLPFVSYGGSSLLVNFIAVGLLINIAQRRPVVIGHRPFSFPDEEE